MLQRVNETKGKEENNVRKHTRRARLVVSNPSRVSVQVVVERGRVSPLEANTLVTLTGTNAFIKMPVNLPANTTVSITLVEKPTNTKNLVKAEKYSK